MKRTLLCIFALILLFNGFIQPCAATAQSNSEITYFNDGSYFEITVNTLQKSRSGNTVSGEKVYSYYNNKSELQWEFVVAGVFEYVYGIHAICTRTACDVYIEDSVWSCTDKSSVTSGDSAVAHAEVVKKFLLVTIQTVPVDLVLTCDLYGNLS